MNASLKKCDLLRIYIPRSDVNGKISARMIRSYTVRMTDVPYFMKGTFAWYTYFI